MEATSASSFFEKARKEFKKLIGIMIYLWVLFTLLAFHKALLTKDNHILPQLGFALFNAHLMAKFVLIGDHFHVGKRLERSPLIYKILFKCAVFSVGLFVVRIIEEGLLGVWHGKSFLQSVMEEGPSIGNGTVIGITMVCSIIFVALIPFFTFREIREAIGSKNMNEILFSRKQRQPSEALDSIVSYPEASECLWYYEEDGNAIGPLTQRQLISLMQKSQIKAQALVWTNSFESQWRRLDQTEIWNGVYDYGVDDREERDADAQLKEPEKAISAID